VAYLKQIRCRNCGAPKITRPKTAYVYCDYCAVYTDYDFQIAISQPESHPGDQYEALLVSLHPRIEASKLANDRDRFVDCQRELFRCHMASCPTSYSPRIGDTSYQSSLLDYLATSQMVSAFHEGAQQQETELGRAARVLRWQAGQIRSDTFWRMFDAYFAQTEIVIRECAILGAFDRHPDQITPQMAVPACLSVFVQGWLPHLAPLDADKLLNKTDLQGQYTHFPDPITTKRHCGNCGQHLQVVEGAHCVLCESCGSKILVDAAEMSCQQCGAHISRVSGATLHSCPYCDSESRLLM